MTDELLTTYFPIREEKVFTATGLDTTKKAIIRADTNRVLGVVSEAYKPIPNRDLFGGVEDTFSKLGMGFEIKKSYTNEKRTYVSYNFPDTKVDIGKNGKSDIVSMQLEVINSYDASHKVWLQLGGFRWVCTNGLVVGTSIMEVSQKHYAGLMISEICGRIQDSSNIYLNKVQPQWQAWNTTDVENADEIMKRIEKRGFPQKYVESANRMWQSETSRTVWSLYNCFTWVTTHEVGSYERSRNLNLLISKEFETIGK